MHEIMMDDIGGRLRRAREQRGLSLRDTAKRTKLSIFTLEAIERNDFARLPGGMFRRAYVRTLAAEVGLDPSELASEYCARFEPPPPPEEPAPTQPRLSLPLDRYLRPSPSPLRSVVVLATMACIWFIFRPGPASREVPVEDTGVELVMAAVPLASSRVGVSAASEPVALRHAIAAKTTAPALRLEMDINGPCWVSAEADGERVVYRLMEPGEHLVLEAQHTLSLRIGDAGAVALSINGAARRSLGRHGEVADLHVTTDNVESLREAVVDTVSHGGPSRPSRPIDARRDARSIRM